MAYNCGRAITCAWFILSLTTYPVAITCWKWFHPRDRSQIRELTCVTAPKNDELSSLPVPHSLMAPACTYLKIERDKTNDNRKNVVFGIRMVDLRRWSKTS